MIPVRLQSRGRRAPGAPSKYKAVPVVVDGIRFDSKREAGVYRQLKIRRRAGEVLYFLRQVPIELPGGVKLRIDFQVFERGGAVRYLDAKGVITEAWGAKRKIAEALYPIKIETV